MRYTGCMRILAIGDIHGCMEEFQSLLDLLALQSCDHLVLLGDLVDRGPDSGAVVRAAMALASRGHVRLTVLRGNHEHKHLRHAEHAAGPQGRRANPVRLTTHQFEVHTQVGAEGWSWLQARAVLHSRPDAGLLAVHAGVLPSVRAWPEGETAFEDLHPEQQKRVLTGALFLRDVDARGRFVPLGEQVPGQRFWGDAYDGRFGHVVHGHSATQGTVRHHGFSTGLDTGCVFGGLLTAAVWHGAVITARPPDELVHVPARQAYASWRTMP